MNDKDKEAFENWWNKADYSNSPYQWEKDSFIYFELLNTWQAACNFMCDEYSNIIQAMTQTSQYNFKLQDENKKLEKEITYFKAIYNSLIDGAARDTEKINELTGQLKSCIFVYEEKVNRLIAENAKLKEGNE